MARRLSSHETLIYTQVYKLNSDVDSRVQNYSFSYSFRLGTTKTVRPQHYILLLLLEHGPHTAYQILQSMVDAGYNYYHTRQIAPKLAQLRQHKLIERDEQGIYHLTPYGEQIAETLRDIYIELSFSSENIKLILDKLRFSKTDTLRYTKIHLDISRILLKILEEIKKIYHLERDELDVVEVLLENYLKYGTPYLYADQIRDKGFDGAYLKQVLKNLQTKNIIYIYNTQLGKRIGFRPHIRELIDKLGSSSYTQRGLQALNTKQSENNMKNEVRPDDENRRNTKDNVDRPASIRHTQANGEPVHSQPGNTTEALITKIQSEDKTRGHRRSGKNTSNKIPQPLRELQVQRTPRNTTHT